MSMSIEPKKMPTFCPLIDLSLEPSCRRRLVVELSYRLVVHSKLSCWILCGRLGARESQARTLGRIYSTLQVTKLGLLHFHLASFEQTKPPYHSHETVLLEDPMFINTPPLGLLQAQCLVAAASAFQPFKTEPRSLHPTPPMGLRCAART